MTDDECIASQARQIMSMELQIKEYREMVSAIRLHLYEICSPLNDNRLGYTKEQLGPFFDIGRELIE